MKDLTAICARYVGVPRVYRGQTPTGWDCWGMLRYVAIHELGVDWPDYAEAYTRTENGNNAATADAIALCLGSWRLVDPPYPGCVACFDRRGRQRVGEPRIFHVGLILNASNMLHVTEDSGTCIERFDGFVWGRYFAGAREYHHE